MNWYKNIKFAGVLLPTETLDAPFHMRYEAIRLKNGTIIYEEYSNHWELFFRYFHIIEDLENVESIGWLSGDGSYEKKYNGQDARDYLDPNRRKDWNY
jgi:hypothetical protein